MTKIHLKEKAIDLRKQGYSYTDIKQKTGVSKSTLSLWLSDIPYKPNKIVRQRLIRAQKLSSLAKNKIKYESVLRSKSEAKNEIGEINLRELFFLGLGVYMGEGSKTHGSVRVMNSDPQIIKLMIIWFKRIFGLTNENFSLRMHLYPDSNISKIKKFWSEQTGLKSQNFLKTQIDLRKNKSKNNKNKLPYGTVQLSVKALGNKDWGVFLSRKILALLAEIYNKC